MEPSRKKTSTTTRKKKKREKGKEPARPGSPADDVRLTKQKRKKKEATPVNVADDLRTARELWMREESANANRDDPMLAQLRGEGSERRTPPQAAPMPFADPPMDNPMQTGAQRMVASARDLMDIKALQELRPDFYGALTPNQVWALVVAERKGQLQREEALRESEARLRKLNETFGTHYRSEHLPAILQSLRERRLATNFFLSIPPGGNRDGVVAGDTLLDLLIADDEGLFRNVWETGTSQASANLRTRGGVEERFGYAFALKRTDGTPLKFIGGGDGAFAREPVGPPLDEDDTSDAAVYRRRLQAEFPNYLKPGEMPKYAAAVGASQAFGVSARYGSSVVYWKRDIDWRTTRTPGDSWSVDFLQSAVSFVGADHPESVFAYTELDIARLAAAEATGFEFDEEQAAKVERDGANLSAYVEAQIHGDLSWRDVDKVVLNYGVFGGIKGDVVVTYEDVERDAEKLRAFAKKAGYDFTVEIGRKYVRPEDEEKT
ncbi:hypothetical protein ACWEFJ_31030 [Actinosynnema sp. NPDC004786]